MNCRTATGGKQSMMLLIFGALLFQAESLLACMFSRNRESFQGQLKYEMNSKSFDECAKACFYDLDCTYVSHVNSSFTNATCNVYMTGAKSISPPENLYKINRKESNSACGNAVRCAAPQQFKGISDSENIHINVVQCPHNPSITTVNVFVNSQGMHAYSTNDSVPLQGFSKNCSMQFVGTYLDICNPVPVYTRGDYLRFFFGNDYEKIGYSNTKMTAFPQYCWYYNNFSEPYPCYSVTQIREYKNQDHYDFVYLEKAPMGYIESDVKQKFWIYATNCSSN